MATSPAETLATPAPSWLRDLCFSTPRGHFCKSSPRLLGHLEMITEKAEQNVEKLMYSRLENDPDLADIVEMFVGEIPGRSENLLRCSKEKNWDELRRIAHQLKGAAGSYGFEPLSASAYRLEHAVREKEPEEKNLPGRRGID